MKSSLATILVLLVAATAHAEDRLGLPNSRLDIAAGSYVLAPPQNWVETARVKGLSKQNFIFYAAKLQATADANASLVNLARMKHTVPQSLVIPIQPGQKAKLGDVVLTWWQSGSGMQRAIVVGGSETEPVVRYLDISWKNPTGAARKDAKLRPDSFHVLSKPMQPGSAVVVRDKSQQRHGLVISKDKKRIAVLGFGGRLSVHPLSAVSAIPIKPKVNIGDHVLVPVFGAMKDATVTEIDARNGRVAVTYRFGSKIRKQAVAFGSVLPANKTSSD